MANAADEMPRSKGEIHMKVKLVLRCALACGGTALAVLSVFSEPVDWAHPGFGIIMRKGQTPSTWTAGARPRSSRWVMMVRSSGVTTGTIRITNTTVRSR